MERFKVTLEAARVNVGLTQEEAAKALGFRDKAIIRKIEQGKRDIKVKEAQALCELYGCTAEDIRWP